MTGSKPKPSCKLLSLLTSRASLGSANFPPIEIELRTPRRRRRHTHLWEPRIIAAAGNRGHLWGEQHGIETRTKRNHSWVNWGRLTIGGNYSRSPQVINEMLQPWKGSQLDAISHSRARSQAASRRGPRRRVRC